MLNRIRFLFRGMAVPYLFPVVLSLLDQTPYSFATGENILLCKMFSHSLAVFSLIEITSMKLLPTRENGILRYKPSKFKSSTIFPSLCLTS